LKQVENLQERLEKEFDELKFENDDDTAEASCLDIRKKIAAEEAEVWQLVKARVWLFYATRASMTLLALFSDCSASILASHHRHHWLLCRLSA
jgi:hypothetical protein